MLNTLLLALFDGVGELVEPTANFSPPDGFPLSALTDSQLFSRTRTPDLTTDRQLTWDFGAPISADVFALFGTNATLTTLRRFRAADNSSITTNVIQSGTTLTAAFDTSLASAIIPVHTSPWGRSLIYIHPTTFAKRYVRWHQSDTANPDGYQEWGIARLGRAWQPVYGFVDLKSDLRRIGSPGSEVLLRGHTLTLHNLTKYEAYELHDFAAGVLSTRRFLVIPEPLAPSTWLRDAIWATLESEYVREPVSGTAYSDKRYKVSMTFREAWY